MKLWLLNWLWRNRTKK